MECLSHWIGISDTRSACCLESHRKRHWVASPHFGSYACHLEYEQGVCPLCALRRHCSPSWRCRDGLVVRLVLLDHHCHPGVDHPAFSHWSVSFSSLAL